MVQYTHIIIIALVLFILFRDQFIKNNDIEYDVKIDLEKKINDLNNKLEEKKITNVPTPTPIIMPDHIGNRDRNVVHDVLYPPIGRTERPIADMMHANYGSFNYPSRGSPDTYRPLANAIELVVNGENESKGEKYQLFGRQKYQGSSQGEYYLASTNRDDAFKIPIPTKAIPDIYIIPDTLTLTEGTHAGSTFKLQELPKPDYTSGYI